MNKSFKSSPGPQSRRPWKGCVAFVTDFSTRHGPEDPLHAKIRLPSGPHSETFLEQNHNTCRRVWSTLPPRGSTGRPAAGCGVHSHPVGRGAHSRTLETRVEHTPVGRRSAEAHVLLFTRSHRPHWETRPEEKTLLSRPEPLLGLQPINFAPAGHTGRSVAIDPPPTDKARAAGKKKIKKNKNNKNNKNNNK